MGVHIYILAYSATLTSTPGLCIATSGVAILFQYAILVTTMFLCWHLVFILLGISVLALGQASPDPSALDLLPACGVRPNLRYLNGLIIHSTNRMQRSCLEFALPVSPCAPNNQTCLCQDEQFEAVVGACVVRNCTLKEQLSEIFWCCTF